MKAQLLADKVRLYESALFRTVSTLVEGEDFLLLVDPTWLPQEVEFLAEIVDALLGERKLYLLFTHSDYDHIIGYGRFPRATVIASAAFVSNPNQASILRQILDFDDSYYLTRNYPIVYPEVDVVIDGNPQEYTLPGETVRFYQAPGHNADGLVTFFPRRGLLIVGDYLSNVEFPYVYHGVAAYRDTLDQLESIITTEHVTLLVSGHGDATSDREEMRRRLTESREYLDKLERAVRSGARFDLPALFRRYAFPKVMSDFHAGNVKLMEKHVAEYPA